MIGYGVAMCCLVMFYAQLCAECCYILRYVILVTIACQIKFISNKSFIRW